MVPSPDMAKEATVFLLVENDKNDVFLVQREFKSAPGNLRLEAVRDGVEAIRYLEGQGDYANRSNFPLPQVILLDLKMPRLRGDEFYLQAKEMRPSLADRFIFITGFATDAKIALFLTKHDVKYLVKPFAIQGLINCLKQLLC